MVLSNLTDVLAPTINEKVSDTAHVAVVEHGCPELCRQDEVGAVGGKSPQVHITLQVQNLALTTGCERGPSAIYRDGACGGDGGSRYQVKGCTDIRQDGDARDKSYWWIHNDESNALLFSMIKESESFWST